MRYHNIWRLSLCLVITSGVGESSQAADCVTVAASDQHSMALADGVVWVWGDGWGGQLGNGSSGPSAYSTQPVSIPGFSDPGSAVAIAAGTHNCHAVRADGTVWGWGNGGSGNFGHGVTDPNPVTAPVQALGITNAIAVAAGNGFTLVLLADGTVWAYGRNASGVLGTGGGDSNVPVQVGGATPLTGVVALAVGNEHSVALVADGTVWTWGKTHKDSSAAPNHLCTRFPALFLVLLA